MKLHCRYSGLPLAELSSFSFRHLPGTSPWITNWKEASLVHPVFTLSRYELTSAYHLRKFYAPEDQRNWNQQDKQLWFLAALHSTGLVRQSQAWLPSYLVASRYFNRVVHILEFLDSVVSPRIASRLPALQLTPESSIVGWLEAVEEAIQDWNTTVESRTRNELRTHLRQRAENKLQSAFCQAEDHLSYLWSIIENELPDHLTSHKVLQKGLQTRTRTSFPVGAWTPLNARNYYCYYKTQGMLWKELFCTSRASLDRGDWDRQDIQDLEEHVLTYVEQGTIASHHIQKRLTQLFLWLQESTDFADSLEILGSGTKAADSAVRREEQITRILTSPGAALTTAPTRSTYTSEVAYLVACIQYEQAQKLRAGGTPEKTSTETQTCTNTESACSGVQS